jgi:two-component system, NtrC family, sensor histidine kinase GlrK
MRITTRVATGLFLVAALLIGALAYQFVQNEKLQSITRELSLIKLEAARISVRLLQDLEGVREFAAKSVVLGDPDYLAQLADWERAVEEDLARLEEVGLSEEEERVRTRMVARWEAYRRVAPTLTGAPLAFVDEMDLILTDLRLATEDLIAANDEVVTERAAAAGEAAVRAQTVGWTAAGLSLVLAGLLSLLLYHSISEPLRRLTRGTRELARGRFDHRLKIQGPGELRSLAKDFNHMAEQLGELEGMKQDFVSHVSHELKNPLAAIQETIAVLLDGLPGPVTSRQTRLLELARKSSLRLSSMISNLLEISRLEGGASTYDPRWCDLREIIRSLVDEMEPLARERNIRMHVLSGAEPVALVCDEERAGDVVGNLVGNALKFSPEGTTVRVSLRRLEDLPDFVASRDREGITGERGPLLLLSVEDEGPGVPDDHKDLIFEKFHQVNPRGRIRGQGVGLGLAIASRIVKAHAGAIWVEDGPGKGAIFRVLLPRVPTRWRDRVPATPPGTGLPSSEGPTRFMGARRTSARLVLATMLVGLGGGGCASAPASEEVPIPVPEPHLEIEGEPPYTVIPPEEVPITLPIAVRLSRGWALLERREFTEATAEFQAVIDEGETGHRRAEALWGIALVNLSPGNQNADPDRARVALRTIANDFRGTLLGAQASWTLALLDEMRQVQEVAARQEAVLRQLGETVDLLKQIDLTRRPARTLRPDSLQSRRPR